MSKNETFRARSGIAIVNKESWQNDKRLQRNVNDLFQRNVNDLF